MWSIFCSKCDQNSEQAKKAAEVWKYVWLKQIPKLKNIFNNYFHPSTDQSGVSVVKAWKVGFKCANTTFKKILLIFLCYDNQINTLSKDKIMHFFRSLYTFYWIFITMIPILLMHLQKKIQTYHWCEFCCVVFRRQKIASYSLIQSKNDKWQTYLTNTQNFYVLKI